jgi:hypothetical protein
MELETVEVDVVALVEMQGCHTPGSVEMEKTEEKTIIVLRMEKPVIALDMINSIPLEEILTLTLTKLS